MKPDKRSGQRRRSRGHGSDHPASQAEHPKSYQIHQSTIRHWCSFVSDPDHPGQQIPLYVLEQRQRAASYTQQHH
jgi:hypothetical protein